MVSPIEDLTGGFGGGDGLFELTPTMTRALAKGRRADPDVPPGPLPEGVVRLDLPRWDTAWEIRKGRGGWPRVDPKTHKVMKKRVVWDALKGNARNQNFHARHKASQEVIAAVVRVATGAGLRPCDHLTVRLVWAPGKVMRADDDNLWQLQKVCCDALARGRSDIPGLHLVPDDSRKFMEKLAPRIDWPPVPGGLWLEVTVDA